MWCIIYRGRLEGKKRGNGQSAFVLLKILVKKSETKRVEFEKQPFERNTKNLKTIWKENVILWATATSAVLQHYVA